MTINDFSAADAYSQILERLRQIGAVEPAAEIERTVARGVIVREESTKVSKRSSAHRKMTIEESLAVAVEFIVTRCNVPLMLQSVRRSVDGRPIEWMAERPGTERESVSFPQGQQQTAEEVETVEGLLVGIVKLAHVLELVVPEVA